LEASIPCTQIHFDKVVHLEGVINDMIIVLCWYFR
jgi:hypothetical protein